MAAAAVLLAGPVRGLLVEQAPRAAAVRARSLAAASAFGAVIPTAAIAVRARLFLLLGHRIRSL